MTTKQAHGITRNNILTMIITIPHYPLSSDASKLGQKRKLGPVCCLGETMYGAGWFVVDFILLMRSKAEIGRENVYGGSRQAHKMDSNGE